MDHPMQRLPPPLSLGVRVSGRARWSEAWGEGGGGSDVGAPRPGPSLRSVRSRLGGRGQQGAWVTMVTDVLEASDGGSGSSSALHTFRQAAEDLFFVFTKISAGLCVRYCNELYAQALGEPC